MSLPLVAAAFGLLFHFGGQEVRRFERLASSDISGRLEGSDKHVSVKVKLGSLRLGHLSEATIDASRFQTKTLPLWTEPERSKQGIIDRLTIHLKYFELGGLPVESMDIDLRNCRWDVAYALREGKIRLSKSGEGTFEADINSEGIKRFLAKRYPFIKVNSLVIDEYKVEMAGEALTPLGPAALAIVSTVNVWNDSGLSMKPRYLSLNGTRIQESQNGELYKLFAPIVDLNRDFHLEKALSIVSVRLCRGKIHIQGRARVPEKTKDKLPGFEGM